MAIATLIFVLSTAMFLCYFQNVCLIILRTEFDREYFQSIATTNRLEFLSVRKGLLESSEAVDFDRIRMSLKCDFLTLAYLVRHTTGSDRRLSRDARLLMNYYNVVYLVAVVRHALRLSERGSVIVLTSILQHLANVVGQHVNSRLDNAVPAKIG